MTLAAPLFLQLGFGFTTRCLLATLWRVIIFRALLALVDAPRRIALCLVGKVCIQFIFLGIVGCFADGGLSFLLAHNVSFLVVIHYLLKTSYPEGCLPLLIHRSAFIHAHQLLFSASTGTRA